MSTDTGSRAGKRGNGKHLSPPPPNDDHEEWAFSDKPQQRLWDMFNELPESIRKTFRDIGSDENPRPLIEMWNRQLRHNGWKLPDAIEWARHYPHGFGIFGWHSVKVFGDIWADLEKIEAERARAKRESGRLRIFTVDDLLKQSPRDYLVKGWLSPNEISLLVGAKNSRKTFTGLHVGYGVAQGWPTVFDRRVKQAPVLYVITEGQGGISKRVQALVSRYGLCNAFFVIAHPVDLLRSTADEGDLHDVIALAQANGVRLIVVDTLSKALSGGDENGPTDMGTLLGNLNTLRHATGAHVMGIHHGTQEKGTKSRGHSLLPNGADAIAQLEWAGDANGIGTLMLGFARDDVCGALGAFRTSVIELGLDEDREKITTLLVDECEVNANAKHSDGQLSNTQAHMLQVLRNVIADCGQEVRPKPRMPLVTAVTRDLLRHALIDAGWFPENQLSEASCDDAAFRPAQSTTDGVKARKAGGNTTLARGAYTLENNALRGLTRKGLLAFNRQFVWLL